MAQTDNESYTVPSSEWLTYKAAGERLGLRPAAVAAFARRDRWPMRKRNDTGQLEVEIPGVLLAKDTAVTELGPDQELRERIAQVVARVDRLEATREREKADSEERAIARARAAAPKRPWWRLGRRPPTARAFERYARSGRGVSG
jgi:hypothetical protein